MIDHTNSVTKKPSLFEIVGLVTVLVSVFFVGYELRQANKIARVETEWQLMNTYASWDEAIISCPECFIQSASAFSSTTDDWFNPSILRPQSIVKLQVGIGDHTASLAHYLASCEPPDI